MSEIPHPVQTEDMMKELWLLGGLGKPQHPGEVGSIEEGLCLDLWVVSR